jgi:hypothetical protein
MDIADHINDKAFGQIVKIERILNVSKDLLEETVVALCASQLINEATQAANKISIPHIKNVLLQYIEVTEICMLICDDY